MSTWAHNVLIVVPEPLISVSNSLSQAITGNEADGAYFGAVVYTHNDASYAVGNSLFTDVTVAALRAGAYPEGAESLAQYLAIDPVEWDRAKICAWVDVDPLTKLSSLGLTPVATD